MISPVHYLLNMVQKSSNKMVMLFLISPLIIWLGAIQMFKLLFQTQFLMVTLLWLLLTITIYQLIDVINTQSINKVIAFTMTDTILILLTNIYIINTLITTLMFRAANLL